MKILDLSDILNIKRPPTFETEAYAYFQPLLFWKCPRLV